MERGKIFVAILFISILTIFFVSSVSALEYKKYFSWKDYWKGVWEKSSDKLKKISGIKQPTEGDKFLGIQITQFGFWNHVGIGLVAGIWIYLVVLVQNFFRIARAKATGGKYRKNPFSSIKTHWTEMVGGRIWKIFIIAFAYGTLLQIPIINRIVQTITLDLFFEGFWKKTFILALVIGFIPSFAEYFMKSRLENKYRKMVTQAGKVGAQAGK